MPLARSRCQYYILAVGGQATTNFTVSDILAMYRAGIFHVALDPMSFLDNQAAQSGIYDNALGRLHTGNLAPYRRESVPVVNVKRKRPTSYSKTPSVPILVHDPRRRTTVGPGM